MSVGEDCAGISVFAEAVESAVCKLDPRTHVQRLWGSELDTQLFARLDSSNEVIHVDKDLTTRDYRTMQPVTCYGAGTPCQHESDAGLKNRGNDHRAKPLSWVSGWLGSTDVAVLAPPVCI